VDFAISVVRVKKLKSVETFTERILAPSSLERVGGEVTQAQ
jgi:hypothetical protein